MKTFTFKIKLQYSSEKYPVVLSVVHCPLEVLFDSLKEVKQFDELYKHLNEPSNNEVPVMYITASDYVFNNGDEYVFNDFVLCKYDAIIESKSLTEFLTHSSYFGFVDDFSTAKTESELKTEVKKSEV